MKLILLFYHFIKFKNVKKKEFKNLSMNALQAWLGQPDVADKVYEAIVKYYLPVQGNIEVSSY